MRKASRTCVAFSAVTFSLMTLSISVTAAWTSGARAATFDWRKFNGTTLRFLSNNNPLAQALLSHKAEFEKLTGITLKADVYQEQQMRQRLVTVLNARSDEVDVFMTLPSREGDQFAAAGWYTDLTGMTRSDVAPDYDLAGISPALIKAATYDGKLTSVPMNIEGPLLYYRTDLFHKCAIDKPATLDDLLAAAKKLKTCDGGIAPFVTRALKPTVAYTFSNLMHNVGGSYIANGKSNLCSADDKHALDLYSGLLRDYGPPGVANYSFYQTTALFRSGRVAMAFESSNELHTMMEGGERLKDTGLMPLPAGRAGSVPTVIDWGMAISTYSKKVGAAWYFVQWATSPEVQAALALQGIAPPRPKLSEQPDVRKWLAAEPVRQEWHAALDVLAAKGSSEVGYPIVANAESRDFVGQAVQELVLKQKTVDQACADADGSLDALIARK